MSSKKQVRSNTKARAKQRLTKTIVQSFETLTQQRNPAILTRHTRLDLDSLTPSNVQQLQHSIGNKTVGQLLARKGQGQGVQTKLKVGPVGDKFEQEADKVARNVMNQLNTPEFGPVRRQDILNYKDLEMKPLIQRRPDKKSSDDDKATAGELAWEVFKPIVVDSVRSLAPGVLKSTQVGKHYKEVIDIVDKLEDSTKKLADYEKKIKEIKKKAEGSEDHKFALKSLGKVNKHFRSIPDAVEIDGEKLIKEAGDIVTSDMFTNMQDAVARLQNYATIVKETKKLRSPYMRMVSRLAQAEKRVKASFDALGVLGDALLDIAKYAVLPAYQAWAFSMSQTVNGYRSDAGTILSTVRNKSKGYLRAIKASTAMEDYMSGKIGRKGINESYREPKNAECLRRLKAALTPLKKSKEAIYENVLPYSECTFEHIMDALDFLPIEETDGFFAVTAGLRDAYNDKVSVIEAKEKRYEAGLKLYVKLAEVRPDLKRIEEKLDPLLMRFIYQEYYRFWLDDPRSLLSNYRYTYTHTIKQMTKNADMLTAAVLSSGYFETR